MQAALQCTDILNEILDYLSPPLGEAQADLHDDKCEARRKEQETLCNVALTCKAFSEPAVKRLWTVVPNFDALLSLLPSSAKVVSDIAIPDGYDPPSKAHLRSKDSVGIMDGPVTDTERARFIWHAQHIRIFHLHCVRRINPAVFLRLSLSRLGAPLTPRLHTLRVHSGWPPYKDMAAQLLSGPALRTLAVTFDCVEATTWVTTDSKPPLDRHSYALRMLLADVAAAAPHLVSLQVCGGVHASLIAPIGTMHALRKLNLSLMVRPFGTDLLRALAGLEELEELALPNKFDAREAVPCRGFKNVRSLTVLRGAQTVPSLLAAMPDIRLREFSLANVESEDIDPIQAVADALSAGPGVHLEVLSLPATLTDWPPILNQPLSTLLAPFFSLKHIKSLHLDSKQPLPTMDEDLRMIGRAWTELEHIRLAYIDFVPDIVAPTINGIVELAYSCPGLKDVCFFADRSVLDPWFTIPLNGLNGPPWIPDEQIRDVGQVARVLYSTFGLRKNKGIDTPLFNRTMGFQSVVDSGFQRTACGIP